MYTSADMTIDILDQKSIKRLQRLSEFKLSLWSRKLLIQTHFSQYVIRITCGRGKTIGKKVIFGEEVTYIDATQRVGLGEW